MNRSTKPPRFPRRGLVLLGALAALLAFPAVGAVAALQDDDQLDTARALLEKWVGVRRVMSKEKRDWAEGRGILNDQIELAEDEIARLRERTAGAEKSIAEADEKKAELEREKQTLVDASANLAATVADFEKRIRALLARIPEPLREHVLLLSQQIPEEGAETKLSLSHRYQNVLGILKEINKFNAELNVRSEIRQLANGTSSQVTTIYVGLGQAYYVNDAGTIAGTGTATAQGWTWTPNDAIAPQVRRMVAVLQEGATAEFIPLPIRVN